jgi:hypothetical protein
MLIFKEIRTLIIIAMVGFLLLMLILPACKLAPQKTYQENLIDTGEPALHAVHSEELEFIMKNLEALTFSRMPQELGGGREESEYLEQAADIADAMANAAQKIPAVTGRLNLKQHESELFLALTAKLDKQAKELSDLARAGETRQARDTYAAITVTCNSCHSAFRLTHE